MSQIPLRLIFLGPMPPRLRKPKKKPQRENNKIVSIKGMFPKSHTIIAIEKAIMPSIVLSQKTNSSFRNLYDVDCSEQVANFYFIGFKDSANIFLVFDTQFSLG